ncbi:MAG: type transport system permease protein [Solirubrobacteraceae bacterium]|jgi:ABC-2 type transport system permease protein|nr:type transport system permease protein [Solirubrobacteraceae bacterium]
MRWLALKDLRILFRSRLLLALLVVYPVAIALLIGLAISRSPSRPRVAIVDETTPGETVQVGSERVSVGRYAQELFSQVQAVRVATRAQALQRVRSADVLAAVVIPPGIAARLSSGTAQGEVQVIYNGDALEQSIVQSQIRSALAQANLSFSEQIQRAAAKAIDLLLAGGDFSVLGSPTNLVGLREIPSLLAHVIAHHPSASDRAALERVLGFANFAEQNLSVSKTVLSTVGQPISVRSSLLHGRRTPLNTFAVVVAVNVSLMFVCILLAAGGVALEREEHSLARLVRGLVSRGALLAEKALLAAGCSFAVAFGMLAGIGAFVTLDWSRAGLWLVALACGAVAFGALGVAIGALAREVRAASLLAFLLSLPLAFLALVPSGAVARGLYDAISAISFVFPFKASLQVLDAAVNRASGSILTGLVHLALLTLLFGALARVGLRRSE